MGSGAVRWWASEVDPYPASSPRIRAPRATAASFSSRTRIPAPSPITKPSRRASNGREVPVGDRACIALKQAKPNSVRVASEPPATAASASPYWIIRSAEPSACAPPEQAETMPYIWPCSPCFIDTAAAAALGM